MKTLFRFFCFCLLATLTITCTTNDTFGPSLDPLALDKLVDEQNRNFPPTGNSGTPAFHSVGSVSAVQRETDENGEVLTFDFVPSIGNERDKQVNYTFEFSSIGEVDFPTSISQARVVYLKNQLVVEDMNGQFRKNFFVKYDHDAKNAYPQIEAVDGIGLGLRQAPSSI